MDLKEYCLMFERTKENVDEKNTMEWLNKSNIAIPNTNLSAIKELILCMDKNSPNYNHLTEEEKAKVEYLLNNEHLVNTVIVTIFRWFGTHVGSHCLNSINKEINK